MPIGLTTNNTNTSQSSRVSRYTYTTIVWHFCECSVQVVQSSNSLMRIVITQRCGLRLKKHFWPRNNRKQRNGFVLQIRHFKLIQLRVLTQSTTYSPAITFFDVRCRIHEIITSYVVLIQRVARRRSAAVSALVHCRHPVHRQLVSAEQLNAHRLEQRDRRLPRCTATSRPLVPAPVAAAGHQRRVIFDSDQTVNRNMKLTANAVSDKRQLKRKVNLNTIYDTIYRYSSKIIITGRFSCRICDTILQLTK